MPQRLDSYPEHPVAVVLAHQLINGDLVAATPDGRPVDLLALDIVAGRPDPSACVIDVSYAAAPLCRLRVSAAGTAEPAGPELDVIDRRTGEVTTLAELLDAFPPMIYFADGCTRGSDMKHPSVDRAGIAVGEPIVSDVTPIAWPRPDGDLPSPPPPMQGAEGLRRRGVLPGRAP